MQGASVVTQAHPAAGLLRIAACARDEIDRFSYLFIVILMTVMTSIISIQVGLRYVFNSSIDWADELARLSFVWVVFLAVPHGVKKGIHVGLDLLPGLMPQRLQDACALFNRAVMAVFFITAGYQAATLTIRNWDNEMPTLGISSGLFFLALTLCCAHSLLHVATRAPLQAKLEDKVDVL
jgi:TRAP-type transport system small permease protein